jgi:hypothetical protein
MGSEMGMGGGGTRAPVAPGADLPTIEPGGGIPQWLTEFLYNKRLGPAGLAGLGGDNGPSPAPLNDKTGVAPATGMNELALQAMGLIARAAKGSGFSGNPQADAVAAVAPAGADGVPADGDIVNPARAGAGGQFGRQPRTGGEYRTRKIRPGETLSGIAGGGGPKRLGGLRGANPSISDPNKIRAGDSINVPVTGVTRAKSGGGGGGGGKKKAIGNKRDIQARAMTQAKEQSGHDRARKKNKQSASKIQARRNLSSGGRY